MICPKQAFFGKNIFNIIFKILIFNVPNFKKFFYNRPRVMRMCYFWMQNRSISQNENVSELNLLINLFPIIHLYLYSKNQIRYQSINKILKIKEYWNFICRDAVLAIAWESDFSQPCSFHRMLKDHENLRFTPITDKANDLIFLRSPKIFLFFCPFLASFFLPKKSCSVTYK